MILKREKKVNLTDDLSSHYFGKTKIAKREVRRTSLFLYLNYLLKIVSITLFTKIEKFSKIETDRMPI